ncbi:SRPBCC family protein (plasmid) [Haladaptatus sp. SPP-AMP-3]|uniref:SRPBCC family protein n=1 Tax=Haladaptatus sp. SPP-AMP-3 TaxID=3121295 RepID=UPI003C2AB8CC
MQSDVRVERGPDGRHLAVSRTTAAPPERVWTVLTDTTAWPSWGPSVTDVECSDRVIRVGSTGRVRTPLGVWVPFEITTCEEFRWTWTVARVPATGHRVEAFETGSRVVFELPLLAAGYVPVCRRALDAIDRLADEEI